MPTPTKGRRIAIVSVVAVVALGGVLVWLSRDQIRFALVFESLGKNAQGYPEYRHRQTGIVFVSLPGGTFMMGSPEDDEFGADDEGLVHEVTLSPFMIGKFEVTQQQWVAVLGSNPSHFRGEDLPVEMVSWEDCQEFCKQTGLSLPTEAQWEYACRAGTFGPFAGTGNLNEMGWYVSNEGATTHPPGEKKANDFGLYDMHGNVFEWCQDGADLDFYRRPEATQKNPECMSVSEYRVLRGGCWIFPAVHCRSWSRFGDYPVARENYIGFRMGADFPPPTFSMS